MQCLIVPHIIHQSKVSYVMKTHVFILLSIHLYPGHHLFQQPCAWTPQPASSSLIQPHHLTLVQHTFTFADTDWRTCLEWLTPCIAFPEGSATTCQLYLIVTGIDPVDLDERSTWQTEVVDPNKNKLWKQTKNDLVRVLVRVSSSIRSKQEKHL